MIRVLLALCLALFLGLVWSPGSALAPLPTPPPGPSSRPSPDVAPVSSSPDCVGSCSAVADGPSVAEPLQVRRWLSDFRSQPLSGESAALESLLFYREATRRELASAGALALDRGRLALLKREVTRDAVYLEVRVRDASGRVRLRLPKTQIVLDRKQHLALENDLGQEVEYSGTVKRVGLDHLWVRL
ncbi:MAG: hypothetical protein JKY65_29645 [Planctomycetes bacterium]|nr:hypothetical protein [Planctomycetota bacterium]